MILVAILIVVVGAIFVGQKVVVKVGIGVEAVLVEGILAIGLREVVGTI